MPWSDLDWTGGDRFRKSYEAAGFDAKSLGEAAGVARHTIGRWVRARHEPQDAKYAAVLGVIANRLEVDAPALARWISTGELPDDA